MSDWYERMTPGKWYTLGDLSLVEYHEILTKVEDGALEFRKYDNGIMVVHLFRRTERNDNGAHHQLNGS